jgi:hypothetical protein
MYLFHFILISPEGIADKVYAQDGNDESRAFAEPQPRSLPGLILDQFSHHGRGTARNDDGEAVTERKQRNKKNAGRHLLLNGNDGQDGRNEAERAGAG